MHSALGLMKAAQLAPDAVLLPVDFDAYRRYSRLFKAAVRAHRAADRGPRHRRDLHRPHRRGAARGARRSASRRRRVAARARRRAGDSRHAVRARPGSRCSIGVAPNKLLAKIASELDKPDGLTLLPHGRHRRAHLAAAGAQDQRHRAEVQRASSTRSASAPSASSRAADPGVADRAFRRALRRVDARSRARARRAPGRHRTASRNRSAARRHSIATCIAARDRDELSAIFTELCAGVATICSARATSARRSGSSCATTISRRVTRDRTIAAPTQDARPSAAPPANA